LVKGDKLSLIESQHPVKHANHAVEQMPVNG